ncbi:MAG: MGMT family protein [Candidatus Buchananbacteria bacterium]
MAIKFKEQVFLKVKLVPPGQVTTYSFLAKALGKNKAYRAVGNTLNKNQFLVKIPCHRVVKSNGQVGGYAKGQKKKIEILKKEGLKIKNGRIEKLKDYLYKF